MNSSAVKVKMYFHTSESHSLLMSTHAALRRFMCICIHVSKVQFDLIFHFMILRH